VVQWPDNGSPDQLWTLEKIDGDGGYLNFQNVNSGLYLGVPDGSTGVGAQLVQGTYNGSNDQKWTMEPVSAAE
jgi:hypothetical protein